MVPVSNKRPSGVYRAITEGWQKRVEDELGRRKWTQKELATRLRCSEGAVSNMLAPGARTSRLVDSTNVLLDLAPPEYQDDIDRDNHAVLRQLREVDRESYDRYTQEMKRAIRAKVPSNHNDPSN